MTHRFALPALLALAACSAPPPAPEGLDASTSYLVRNFYADDATLAAGVVGMLNWVDTEGAELLDIEATTSNVDGFSIGDLGTEDVALLPYDGTRDLSRSKGAVALSVLDCGYEEVEALLVRPDQSNVFDDFDTYERDFLSDRGAFESATAAGEYPSFEDGVPLHEEGFDPAAYEDGVLVTLNHPESTELGVTLGYDLHLHQRHGVYEIRGEETRVLSVITYTDKPFSSGEGDGDTTLVQSYSVEVNIDQGGEVFRLFAVWNEFSTNLLDYDSPIFLTSAVNKTRDSSARLSDICRGDYVVEED